MTLPLSDVRVISVEQFGAGPWATMQLADLGAEVIKIEDPTTGGDVGRYVPPYQEGTDSLFFESFNRNKKSLSLDLRSPAGRAVFEDLVREADLVCSNLRGDLPERLRLTYEHLAPLNPAIVCCSLSGFGMTGPRASEAAYDYLVQGLAGWMSLTGGPDAEPTKSGLSLVDLSGGYVAAIAALSAIHGARRDGIGCDCDISLFETALAELMYVGTWTATRDYQAPRWENSAHPSLVPFQNFRSADSWLVVACAKEKFWRRLCRGLGRPGLASDPRFATFALRDRNRHELLEILDHAFLQRTTAEWLDVLGLEGVPVAPVNDVRAALEDPQVKARDGVVEFEHPTFGRVRQVATPLRVGTEPKPAVRAPFYGEHTEEVLAGILGYSGERIDQLTADRVVGRAELVPAAAGAAPAAAAPQPPIGLP